MNELSTEKFPKKYTNITACPVRNIITRFSGKWAMLILCILSDNGTTRFNAISKAIPDISPKVLTETLKSLEADGFINRKLYAEIPPRVEYSLTPLGESLMPVIGTMIDWAMANFDKIAESKRK